MHWEGQGKKGQGKISTETGALKDYPYGFASRFEDDRRGTNPEEILGAAHAACFTMAFSFACDKAGFATAAVDTKASVRLVAKGDGFAIDHITLEMDASVPGIDNAKFQEIAQGAKANCPLSKALASVPEIGPQSCAADRQCRRCAGAPRSCGRAYSSDPVFRAPAWLRPSGRLRNQAGTHRDRRRRRPDHPLAARPPAVRRPARRRRAPRHFLGHVAPVRLALAFGCTIGIAPGGAAGARPNESSRSAAAWRWRASSATAAAPT